MFFCNLDFAISRCKSKKKNREYLKIHHFFIIFIYSAFIHRLFLSTDYHRLFLIHRLFCPQIITDFYRLLNIKDILIITDFILHLKCILHSSFFWHGNPRLFQSHGLAPHRYNHGTSWLRLACASSLLSLFFCANEPCLYFV